MTESYVCQILRLTEKNVLILKEMKEKGFITRTPKIYKAALGFYINIWFLRDEGLVHSLGSDREYRKKWCLTEKGRKIISLVEEIYRIWKNSHD